MVSKTDIELELQTTLPDGYTTDYITSMSDYAEAAIQAETNRISFTGNAATLYIRATLCWVISKLVAATPGLSKGSISELSENNTTVKFANGKGVATYELEYKALISVLSLKPYAGHYTYVPESTYYTE